jgi:alkanesulfonate monooxygenase SsuD/methylene tetrahydromethanopterin reductase-like flavin-dependent oxidoreductase (luciferase family)
MIRLGLHYDVREPAGSPEAISELHRELVAHVAALERHDLDIAWLAEHPADPEAAIPSALMLCAAIAAVTTRLRFGTGVLPLPLYHPLRVAEDAATIDGIADGRFELGVGLGGEREGFQGFGIEAAERATRLEESIELLRQAWSAEPVKFSGAHFEIDDIDVVPKPVQSGGPPLWIGAGAPEAQRRAARFGAGLFLPEGVSPEPYIEAWEGAGNRRDDARLAVLLEDCGGEADPSRLESFAERVGALDVLAPAYRSDSLGNNSLASAGELESFAAHWRRVLE